MSRESSVLNAEARSNDDQQKLWQGIKTNSPDNDDNVVWCVCSRMREKQSCANGIVGKVFETGFIQDGEYIQVSSSHMPDNGTKAFDSIEKILSKAWSS